MLRYQVSQIYDLTVIFRTYAHDICLALPNWLFKLSWIFDISRFEPLGIAVIILAVGVEAKGRSYSVFSVRESKQQRWSNYFVYLQSTSTAWCCSACFYYSVSTLVDGCAVDVSPSPATVVLATVLVLIYTHFYITYRVHLFEISNTWIVLVVILYKKYFSLYIFKNSNSLQFSSLQCALSASKAVRFQGDTHLLLVSNFMNIKIFKYMAH